MNVGTWHRGKRTRTARAALCGAVALAAGLAAYILVANIVLMTPIGASLVSAEDRRVRWRHGWSFVPMRVHLRDVELDV